MNEQKHITLTIPKEVDPASICGPADVVLRAIESHTPAKITVRGNVIDLYGHPADLSYLTSLFSDMFSRSRKGMTLDAAYVDRTFAVLKHSAIQPESLQKDILHAHNGKVIRPKTSGQKQYADAIRNHTITFGIGPAGTGKTYIAVALAVAALERKEVSRIVLSRPIVQAGESLGFLPGTFMEKVDPYMRPLYDALFEMLDFDKVYNYLEQGIIEIVPLAFMRGRTLNDSFVILDEAQNTTPEQMKMFLTRLGFNSKMVVTGDITQIDLPTGTSGLVSVESILKSLDRIAFCKFTDLDIVRHSLVADIVAAYEGANR